MSLKREIQISTEEAKTKLKELEQIRRAEAESINNVTNMARLAYMATVNVIEAAGGSVSALFTSLVTVGLETVSLMSALAGGLWATPGGQVQAAIMTINIGIAIAAIIATQTKQAQVASQLASAQMAIHSVSALMSSIRRFGG